MNWGTKEVIDTLINDASEVLHVLKYLSVQEIEQWVKSGNAPNYLYVSFKRYNASFDSVNWQTVKQHMKD